ncbi:MAG: DUF1512 family protein [Candidatus Aenigmatarchaeota archaeon]
MDYLLAQLGNGDWLGNVIWIILIVIFMLYSSRIMITQTVWKLEKDVVELEEMARTAKGMVLRKVAGRHAKHVNESLTKFMEFFAISPVAIDPYGVMKKIDLVVKQSDERFKLFARQIAPRATEEELADIRNALGGAMTVHQIAKIMRHYLEMIKRDKVLQLALIVQMQMPMIERLAKAAVAATDAFVREMPIGDGIGPLVAASMIPVKAGVRVYREEEVAVAKAKVGGRSVWIAKAAGPGASTGYPGKFMLKFCGKNKISRIITVDAALKLEGEKAGSIAEGVGIAMGGVGTERYDIENIAVAKGMTIDAIAIKVSEEEALKPMIREVADAVPAAVERVTEAVKRAKRGEDILIFGVGNTCGVGNNEKAAADAQQRIRRHASRERKK